jgi:hypothetical protein
MAGEREGLEAHPYDEREGAEREFGFEGDRSLRERHVKNIHI